MKTLWKIMIPLAILLIFVWVAIWKYEERSDLRKNGVLVEALIIDVLPSGKATASPSFKCEFRFNGKKKIAISNSSIKGDIFSYLGKNYPALYSERTNTIRLLMNRDDYEKYNRKYPDSLQSLDIKPVNPRSSRC